MTPQHHAQFGSREVAPVPVDLSYEADRCPDCGGTAQGRGFFGHLYCGLCERSLEVAS